MTRAIDIAWHIIAKLDSMPHNNAISNLKVQKLLYFAQRVCLTMFDRPLFEDEIEAWRYGPVVASVFQELNNYGSEQGSEMLKPNPNSDLAGLDTASNLALQATLREYGSKKDEKLVALTHGDPLWVSANVKGSKTIIPLEDIQDSCREAARKLDKKTVRWALNQSKDMDAKGYALN